MENYISLSYPLNKNTPLYGGGKGIEIFVNKSIKLGDSSNTKKILFDNHSGTHIDFPNHFFDDGKDSSSYDTNFWIFDNPYLIINEINNDVIIDISREQLEFIPENIDILIYKTGFGKYRNEEKYWKNNPGFSANSANILREKFPKLRVLGMDLISLTAYQNRQIGREAHKNFLNSESPILLIEDMNLQNLLIQPKQVICSPLLLDNVDGTPINIIAKL